MLGLQKEMTTPKCNEDKTFADNTTISFARILKGVVSSS